MLMFTELVSVGLCMPASVMGVGVMVTGKSVAEFNVLIVLMVAVVVVVVVAEMCL